MQQERFNKILKLAQQLELFPEYQMEEEQVESEPQESLFEERVAPEPASLDSVPVEEYQDLFNSIEENEINRAIRKKIIQISVATRESPSVNAAFNYYSPIRGKSQLNYTLEKLLNKYPQYKFKVPDYTGPQQFLPFQDEHMPVSFLPPEEELLEKEVPYAEKKDTLAAKLLELSKKPEVQAFIKKFKEEHDREPFERELKDGLGEEYQRALSEIKYEYGLKSYEQSKYNGIKNLQRMIANMTPEEYKSYTDQLLAKYREVRKLVDLANKKKQQIIEYDIFDISPGNPANFSNYQDMAEHIYIHLINQSVKTLINNLDDYVLNIDKYEEWAMFTPETQKMVDVPGQLENFLAKDNYFTHLLDRYSFNYWKAFDEMFKLKMQEMDSIAENVTKYLKNLNSVLKFIQVCVNSRREEVRSYIYKYKETYGPMMDEIWNEHREIINQNFTFMVNFANGTYKNKTKLDTPQERRFNDYLASNHKSILSNPLGSDIGDYKIDYDYYLLQDHNYLEAADQLALIATLFIKESLELYNTNLLNHAFDANLDTFLPEEELKSVMEKLTPFNKELASYIFSLAVEQATGVPYRTLISRAPSFNFDPKTTQKVYQRLLMTFPEETSSLRSFVAYPRFLFHHLSKENKKKMELLYKEYIIYLVLNELLSAELSLLIHNFRKIMAEALNKNVIKVGIDYSSESKNPKNLYHELSRNIFLQKEYFADKILESMTNRGFFGSIKSSDLSTAALRRFGNGYQIEHNNRYGNQAVDNFAAETAEDTPIDFSKFVPNAAEMISEIAPYFYESYISNPNSGFGSSHVFKQFKNQYFLRSFFDNIIETNKQVGPEDIKKKFTALILGRAFFPFVEVYKTRYSYRGHSQQKDREISIYNSVLSFSFYTYFNTLFRTIFTTLEFDSKISQYVNIRGNRWAQSNIILGQAPVMSSDEFYRPEVLKNVVPKNYKTVSEDEQKETYRIYLALQELMGVTNNYSNSSEVFASAKWAVDKAGEFEKLFRSLPRSVSTPFIEQINYLINIVKNIKEENLLIGTSHVYHGFAVNRARTTGVGPRTISKKVIEHVKGIDALSCVAPHIKKIITDMGNEAGDKIEDVAYMKVTGLPRNAHDLTNNQIKSELRASGIYSDSTKNLDGVSEFVDMIMKSYSTYLTIGATYLALACSCVRKSGENTYQKYNFFYQTIKSYFQKKLVSTNVNYTNLELIEAFNNLLEIENGSIESKEYLESLIKKAVYLASMKHNHKKVSFKVLNKVSQNVNFKDYISKTVIVRKAFDLYLEIIQKGGIRGIKEEYGEALSKYQETKVLRGFITGVRRILSIFYNNVRIYPDISKIEDPELFKQQSIIRSTIESVKAGLDLLEEYEAFKEYSVQAKPKNKELFALNWNVDSKNFRFRVLSDLDPLHFRVGDMTQCCQRLGGEGENAAIDSYINPTAGIVALEIKMDTVWLLAAQSYFHYVEEDWSGKKGFILDNVESNSKIDRNIRRVTGYTIEELYAMLAERTKRTFPNLTYFLAGKGFSDINTSDYKKVSIDRDPRHFEGDKYTDWSPRSSLNLLNPKFEVPDDVLPKQRKRSELILNILKRI